MNKLEYHNGSSQSLLEGKFWSHLGRFEKGSELYKEKKYVLKQFIHANQFVIDEAFAYAPTEREDRKKFVQAFEEWTFRKLSILDMRTSMQDQGFIMLPDLLWNLYTSALRYPVYHSDSFNTSIPGIPSDLMIKQGRDLIPQIHFGDVKLLLDEVNGVHNMGQFREFCSGGYQKMNLDIALGVKHELSKPHTNIQGFRHSSPLIFPDKPSMFWIVPHDVCEKQVPFGNILQSSFDRGHIVDITKAIARTYQL